MSIHKSFQSSLSKLALAFLLGLPASLALAQQTTVLPTTNVTASRTFDGIVGASTTVITAEDIAHSPALTLQGIIAQAPGVQLTTLYGGVNGAGTTVDMRGFGAFASANTLVLINGRRLNDLDLQGVDLSTIPRDSIERIEITRGNSGAVLYGDNAIGGVINIVTKTGAGAPASARIEGGIGSFDQREISASANKSSGPWSAATTARSITSDGYRENNNLYQQSAVGELRYSTPDLSAYFNIFGDNQRLRLPGGRIVDPSINVNELATNRRGAATPNDYTNTQTFNLTTGFTKSLGSGADLIIDGGFRNKDQQGFLVGSYLDAELQTWSFTPRLKIKSTMFGMPSDILTGIDFYDYLYSQDRGSAFNAPVIHAYDVTQRTLAGYWQQTLAVLPTTTFSYGARIQRTDVKATDQYNAPPGCAPFCDTAAAPLDQSKINHALHAGIEHRFTDSFAVFGRVASAFRTPNVDERVGAGPFGSPIKTFDLQNQTSNDIEGGVRVNIGQFKLQSSVYNMNLKNEIHFDPVNFIDTNLDPTRRYGSETSITYRASGDLLLRGGFAYTRAVFREGAFAGNDVPLVSRYTANAGFTWNIWKKYLVADATYRYWSSRRMDNDQANAQSKIPADGTVDLKLSGEYERFFWSASVNNLFDALYYNYAVASTFTPGRFNAYPLPGRTYMLKAGVNF